MQRHGILGVRLNHPAQLVVAVYAVTIFTGTALLTLPASVRGPGGESLLTAFFTATSAVCITGLAVVDTPIHWSGFGHVVILVLVQLGGIGIMALASISALAISHHLGLRGRMLAQAETGALNLGDVRRVLRAVVAFTVVFEVAFATALTASFWIGHGEPLTNALRLGVFHAISAFNNAGFALFSDNLEGFVADPWISLTVALAVIAGGIGFPVWLDLWREPRRFRRWSLHTKLTLAVAGALLAAGFVTVLAFEWSNGGTLGPLDVPGKLVAGFFQATTPRTAGFNSVPYAEMSEPSQLVTILLMFIGGGSASTAGGVKVTTVAVLALMVWAELRGDPDVSRFGRRIPPVAQRQALSVVVLGLAAVFAGNLVLLTTSGFGLTETLFEATSAFGTVGLSLGITPQLAAPAQLALTVLMFIGRVGPITLGTALVLRERERLYRYPEERPIVG